MLHKTVEDKISLYFFVPIKESTSLTGEEGDIFHALCFILFFHKSYVYYDFMLYALLVWEVKPN